MPAAYGHTPNMVTATIKSGTDQLHGELFEFMGFQVQWNGKPG
jgi:hypothetical protein